MSLPKSIYSDSGESSDFDGGHNPVIPFNPMRYRIITWALAVLALALPSEGLAEIFRYLAPDGSVHYSNVPVEGGYRPYTIRSDVGFSRLRSMSPRDRSRYYRMIDDTALKYQLDPALIRAVVKAESDYDP